MALTPLHWVLNILGCLGILALSYRRLTDPARQATLEHDDEKGLWHLHVLPGHPTSGTLVYAGYRSALVVVLAIQTDRLTIHRIAIWRDQLPPVGFSYLHYQLQFNTKPRQRQSLGALLGSLGKVIVARQQR